MAADAVETGDDEDVIDDPEIMDSTSGRLRTEADYRTRAAAAYAAYSSTFRSRFKWLPSTLFIKSLAKDLNGDAIALLDVLKQCGDWNADADSKLAKLIDLIETQHPTDKLLIFTQFADTAHYLKAQLVARGVKQIDEATGDSADPTHLAWRFSPESNGKRDKVPPAEELRVIIATDVLSEGQNLQDCSIIVNYDLPWAIVHLIQRPAAWIESDNSRTRFSATPSCRQTVSNGLFACVHECASAWSKTPRSSARMKPFLTTTRKSNLSATSIPKRTASLTMKAIPR